VTAIGNHEYIKNEAGHKVAISPFWNPQFNFPANGPPGLASQAYYLDFANTRLIVLNSNKEIDQQAPWLEEVLKSNRKKWTIISFHHPIYSAATGRENEGINQHWKPLFDRYSVDLILQGHDHVYARGNGKENTADTPVYVVSVSGPKMYDLSQSPDWAKVVYANLQLFQTVRIVNDRLIYEAKTVTGELKDRFELQKNGRGETKLIEKLPEP
jgi:acid phosphatase type 7